jgi:hypothetical protein
VLEGNGPLAKETIVVGAHYDHLGYGGRGSLLRDPNQKAIHNGADDNASGTTALLELARRYGAQNGRAGRRLVFIAFSAEESGLIGSAHYVKNPIVPLKDTAAMVNLDMVGRLRPDPKTGKDRVLVEGSGTAKTFEALLDDLVKKYDLTMVRQKSGYGPSDHESFYSAKPQIPVIFFWTGDHPDYHKPSDTADKINVAGMRKIVELTEDVLDHLTTVKERPEVVSLPRPTRGPGPGGGPTLGIRPGYGEDVEGVLVGGVTPGRPAAKAGIQEGDLIVEIGGRRIKNLEGYMVQLRNFRKGDTVDVAVVRGGKKVMLKVTLE